MHVWFVDALIWVADSSGDDGTNCLGKGPAAGGEGEGEGGGDAIPWFDGFDCAEAILLDVNPTPPPAAVRTVSADKDNAMTIRIILLFVNMIL